MTVEIALTSIPTSETLLSKLIEAIFVGILAKAFQRNFKIWFVLALLVTPIAATIVLILIELLEIRTSTWLDKDEGERVAVGAKATRRNTLLP